MTSDPIRLLDDPSAAASLRGDLASAADVRLEGLDQAAGLTALQAGLAAEATATGSGVGLSMLTKVGIGAVAIAGALALWLGLGDADSTSATPQVAEVAVEPVRHGGGTVPASVPAVPESAAARPEAAEPAVSPEPSVEAEPLEAAKAEPASAEPLEAVQTEPASATEESPRRKGRTARRSTSTPESGDAPFDDSVLREARMVAKARSSLAGDPERALTLTEKAEKDFPDGQLVEERRAIAIEALASLGRTEEAERRADRFLAKYGRGAHAAAVRRAIGR